MTATMPEQLTFPSSSADARTAAVLALIAGDPVHERDREAVVAAIVADATANGGEVNPNRVRRNLPIWVYPRSIGATYRSLATVGALKPAGWTVSDDRKGRNSGRPARLWRWIGGDLCG